MIRTRFAPSPTGELHIGGARTALFNFLLARGRSGGRFVLRIDDTDRERSRSEYERRLLEDLHWLGLDWDEGPDRGGEVSYRQSERTFLYDGILRLLREQGAIYPCFCSKNRLETLRKEQIARGEPPRYDGRCRALSPKAAREAGVEEKPCWRFALPDRTIAFHDAVRGLLSFSADSMGDFVVARSDGQPTYLFASVADDHLMEITHIVRGDEHVPNTARQQAIFDALEWTAPVYAHIPMILSPDRQKLSKRTGSTPIRQYREEGYLPEALSAYLSTLSWMPESETSLLSLADTASVFSLSRVSASSPVHDETHLKRWQKEAAKKRGEDFFIRQLIGADPRFAQTVLEAGGAVKRLVADLLEENCTLPLLKDAVAFLTESPVNDASPPDWLPEARRMLRSVSPWDEDGLNQALRSFMKERGLKGKDFFHPLRRLLTGRESGPALPLAMYALGRGKALERLTGERPLPENTAGNL